MKYLLLNTRSLLRAEKSVCAMLVFGFLFSALAVLFCYGTMYQVFQGKLTELNEVNYFKLEFPEETAQMVSWDEVKQACQKLDRSVTTSVGDVTLRTMLDGNEKFVFDFSLDKNGNPEYLDWGPALQSQGLLYDGRWYTKKEFDNAELVAVGNPYRFTNVGDQGEYTKQYETDASGDTYLIDGKIFQRVGAALLTVCPTFPVTVLDGDEQAFVLGIEFDDYSLTQKKYENICEVFQKQLGSRVSVPKLTFPELDRDYYYLVAAIVIVLAGISALILSLLYEYLFLQQKRTYAVYRVCGMKRKQVLCNYLGQCVGLFSIAYGMVMLLFHFVLLQFVEKQMLLFREAYSAKVYVLIYLALLAGNLLIASGICLRGLRGSNERVTV